MEHSEQENSEQEATELVLQLIERLRETGPSVDDNGVVTGRIPDYRDCHEAADHLEGLLLYTTVMKSLIDKAADWQEADSE